MPTFQGAIFDVDGVLVDSPHEKAWRESLRELMEGEWSDIREQTSWIPGVHHSGVPAGDGRQAADGRRPGRAGVLRGARRRGPDRTVRGMLVLLLKLFGVALDVIEA